MSALIVSPRHVVSCARALFFASIAVSTVPAASQPLEPVSLEHDGDLSPNASDDPFISANGRFVVFTGGELLPDDDPARHVYIYDRNSQQLERITERWDGGPSTGVGSLATNRNARVVTDDGRWVFFHSTGDDLVQGANGARLMQLWARDRQNGVTHLVSQASDGSEANSGVASEYAVAPDQPRAIFNSFSTNLDPDDTDGISNTFWRDVNGTTTRLACIRTVLEDRSGGDILTKVDNCRDLALSCGGQFMAFTTSEDGLDEMDQTVPRRRDVYAGTVFSGDNTLLTRDHAGIPSNTSSHTAPSIDCANRRVVFGTRFAITFDDGADTDWDIYVRDIVSEQVWRIDIPGIGSMQPVLSSNGRHLAFDTHLALDPNDQNGSVIDIYRIEFPADVPSSPILVSLHNGESPNLNCYRASISDGGAVTFGSTATNLMPIPENTLTPDVFVTGPLSDIFADGFESGDLSRWN